MKYIISHSKICTFLLGLVFVFSSCDKGFEELNTNPKALTAPVVENLFSYSIVRAALPSNEADRTNMMYCGGMMQYFSSLSLLWTGDKYLYSDYSDVFFTTGYTAHIKELQQIVTLLKDSPEEVNKYAIARIWKVFAYHRITDLYGDVPYSKAAKGYLENIYSADYDTQQAIYADMLKELEESVNLLDPSKPSYGPADFLYNGDIAKWKRFAYSLMLRLGMRLTKVDAAMAETWAKKAIAGGVMQSNADIARLQHTDGPTNNNRNYTNYWILTHENLPTWVGKGVSKLARTFVDHLKNTQDPRLPFYSTLWEGNVTPSKLPVTSDPAVQKGLPNGYDNTTIKTIIPAWTENMLTEYSEINLNTIGHVTAPTVFLSYSEIELLLAEAALRGWDGGSVKTHYENGVRASAQITTIYPGNFVIGTEAINTYLAANPVTVGGGFDTQMEQIHTQMWVTLFMNNIEAYANFRRTGYPDLTPTNFPGNETGGTIPRRLRYPSSEAILNKQAYDAVTNRQGPDQFTTRMWWDKN